MNPSDERELRTQLTALQQEVAAQRAVLKPRRTIRRTTGAKKRWGAVFASVVCMALVPLSILAAAPVFSDLGTAAPEHQPNIQAIGNAGITTGFEDPNNPSQRLYDPKANVTREEMASFLARTAGLGANKPVTNAARLASRSATVGGTTYAANDLVYAARNSDDSAEASVSTLGGVTSPPTIAITTTIKAPGAGYILVNASGIFRFGGLNNCAACTVQVTLAGSPLMSITAAESPTVTLSRTWLVRVNAAGDQNLQLVILVTRPGQQAPIPSGTFTNGQLTAVYVPFGTLNNGAPGDIVNP